ncbi:phage baseplate assembly protein V [Flavobacterium sp.]|uniref:type VI secretion system Vgr family protein n=1 Tax=Flavobacterium sp. TaxID=239 RepID=UPI00286A08EC|nr:phage baseplate assembly protein V [Flavobacterium sp.]
MAIGTQIKIEISSEILSSFSDLKIHQKANDHHTFSLTRIFSKEFVAEAMDKAQSYMGLPIRITIEPNNMKTDSSLVFYGIVTRTDMIRMEGSAGMILIEGFSPSIVMDGRPNAKSFSNKSFSDIIREISESYPQSEINKPNIDFYNDTAMSYTVQYGESDYAFLNRMARKKGEWFYYNGQQTFFGRPKSKDIELEYGRSLHKLSIGMQVKPLGFEYLGYDASSGQIERADTSEINHQPKGYSKSVYDASKKMYPDRPTSLYSNPMMEGMSRNHLINRATTQLQSQTANLIVAKGESDETGIRIGDVLIITESSFSPTGNVSDGVKEQNFGSYIVTDIIHTCDISGRYTNSFEAVPDTVLSPPYGNVHQIPNSDTQPAKVIDNNDSKGLGRVQVQLAWQKQYNEKTPWIRMTNPHAGGGKGMHFIPEIGEEVLVGFEGGNAEKPFVLGAMYNGNETSGFHTAGNDLKIIQSRSGTKIIMNDAIGSVFIEDPSGNTWLMDGKGNTKLNVPNDMSITVGKNLNISVGENMTTRIGANEDISIGGNKTETIAKNYIQNSDNKNVTVKNNKTDNVGNSYKQMAGDSDIQTSKGDLKLRGTTLTVIQGGKDVKVSKG